jgi:hypothetical protein
MKCQPRFSRCAMFTCLIALLLAQVGLADGVVTVTLRGNNLVVTGDAGSNGFGLFPAENAPLFIDMLAAPGTVIRAPQLDFEGVSLELPDFTNISIDLGAGLDGILVQGVAIPGNFLYSDNAGPNSVTLDTCVFGGSLGIKCGNGDSDIAIFGALCNKNLQVQLGNGKNTLVISEWLSLSSASISTGDGDDSIMLQTVVAPKGFRASLGNGNNVLTCTESGFGNQILVLGGDDDDLIGFSGCLSSVFPAARMKRVTINLGGAASDEGNALLLSGMVMPGCRYLLLGGDGRDQIAAGGVFYFASFAVLTQDGDDTFQMATSVGNRFQGHLGDGNDTAIFADFGCFGPVKFTTSNGNDDLTLVTLFAERGASFDGGAGDDILRDAKDHDVPAKKLKITGFEQELPPNLDAG